MVPVAPMPAAVPFIHPSLAALALGAAAIPVLIHLINRRRYVRVPFAAMTFLLAANRRSTRRVRLEQWLLLLMRVAIVVVFGLAVARPYFSSNPLPSLGASRAHHVILLDNSLSMGARVGAEGTRFGVAKACAERLLASFPSGDAVSLVTLAAPAKAVVAAPLYDRRVARERLAAVSATQHATDTVAALATAMEILEDSHSAPGNRAVYLLSDLPRGDWRSAAGGAGAEPTPAVSALRRIADTLVDPARQLTVFALFGGAEETGTEDGNVAITAFAPESALLGTHVPVRLGVEIRNFGRVAVRDLSLELRHGGRIIRRETVPVIEPDGTYLATVTVEFVSPGTQWVEARLSGWDGDVLEVDDARSCSIEVPASTRVLLVDGRPGETPLTGQAGFVSMALAPRQSAATTGLIEPKVIGGPELPSETLSDYELVVLCGVERLSEGQWRDLEGFVDAGGGLLVFAGELVNAENYNRLGFSNGSGVLPGRFGRIVEASGAAEGDWLTFAVGAGLHPIVADLADLPTSGLFVTRVQRYLSFEPELGRAQVVLPYSDGAPALVVASHGRGRTVVFTTTANMDWSNLPAKGDFVSLLLGTVAYLSPQHGTHRNLLVGEMLVEPITATQSALPAGVDLGDGLPREPSVVPNARGLSLQFGPIDRTGRVALSVGAERYDYAVNADPRESDVRSIRADELAELVGRPMRIMEDPAFGSDRTAVARSAEYGLPALYLVIALLVLEMTMAMWFGSHRGGG